MKESVAWNVVSETTVETRRFADSNLSVLYISPRSGSTQRTGFAAIKLTALGRPQLLVGHFIAEL